MSLTTTQVVETAIEIGETRLPANYLICRLREKFKVSENVAITAYRKAVRENALVQRHVDRWAPCQGHHARGMYNVITRFWYWEKGENNDNEH